MRVDLDENKLLIFCCHRRKWPKLFSAKTSPLHLDSRKRFLLKLCPVNHLSEEIKKMAFFFGKYYKTFNKLTYFWARSVTLFSDSPLNMDTRIIWALWHVLLVFVFTWFHCCRSKHSLGSDTAIANNISAKNEWEIIYYEQWCLIQGFR